MPPVELREEWCRLRGSLELDVGFAYYLIFTNWPDQVRAGADYLADALRFCSLRLQTVVPTSPDRLVREAFEAMYAPGLPIGTPLWLECWRHPDTPEWQQARRVLMARLNEGRSRLEQEMRRPLVLLLPLGETQAAAENAPDMWSIRRPPLYLERPVAETAGQSLSTAPAPLRPTPESAARAERYLADWQRQWHQAGEDKGRLSLPDAAEAVTALLEVGRIAEARTVAEQALSVAQQRRAALGDTPQALRDLSISLNKVGQVARDLGDLESSRAAYAESLELFRQLRAALGDTPQALRDLSVSLNKVGQVARDLGDLDASRAAYAESLELSRQLRAALGDTPAILEDLARTLGQMASLHRAEKEAALARRDLEEGRLLASRLALSQPNHVGYVRLLAAFDADLAGLRQFVPDAPSQTDHQP